MMRTQLARGFRARGRARAGRGMQQLGRIERPGGVNRDERGPERRGKRRGKCAGKCAGTGGTIKIGGGFALTGDESALDLPAANGAKLAVKEINAAGGVNGSQIDFIVHDSQYKMDVTAQTAKQFVEQDKVPLMIGYTDTDSVLASGPTFQSRQDPVHHGRRDVAEDPDPGRRHDVPGLLRR